MASSSIADRVNVGCLVPAHAAARAGVAAGWTGQSSGVSAEPFMTGHNPDQICRIYPDDTGPRLAQTSHCRPFWSGFEPGEAGCGFRRGGHRASRRWVGGTRSLRSRSRPPRSSDVNEGRQTSNLCVRAMTSPQSTPLARCGRPETRSKHCDNALFTNSVLETCL